MNLRMLKNGIRCPTATVDTKAEETMMKEKMWYVISQNEPSLLPIPLASKLLTKDCMACVDLLEVMLVEHLRRLLLIHVKSRRKKRGAEGADILHQWWQK
ncbi:protein ILITYHIA isoform X2 [Rosa chinensis]|uniref:protein ILITYHIA isoform X2 n=1 Tax=Rosa chinensis TaxID=74649 RepID=UPI000D09516D|nr:protein ILITYHIA isoform X2 [Rosa chinensis]